MTLIYEGLTRLDANQETIPGAAESWEYGEGDDELWATETETVTPVVEAPTEHRPQQQGRTLGQG